MSEIIIILNTLYELSKQQAFKGYDPYDGLYLANPFGNLLKKNKFSRLFLIHFNKRAVYNFRPLFGIQPDINPKTLALFVSGLIRQGRADETEPLLDLVKKHKSPLSDHAAWGYYFDWQSRVFFQPAHTPTVVATAFVCNALLDLYETTNDKELLALVESSISFFTNELNIFENENGVCFSYSPLDNSVIYNASALGLEVIARYQKITGKENADLNLLLGKGINFLKTAQNPDGSWFYGKQPIQHFIDHYHTAYILESLENIDSYTEQSYNLKPSIERGLSFYLENMFTKEAAPKFYKNAVYPLESHCSGAAVKALCILSNRFGKELFEQAVRISDWTIENLYDQSKGYFYYHKRKFWTNKVNYLRWSQAWMFAGLSNLLHYGKKYGYSFDQDSRRQG